MSENAIYFFSGTGNSFDVAKRLSETMLNTKLYNIATVTSMDESASYKRVGIVFPIYGFTMPNIVKRFIHRLPFQEKTYYFCVATLGAVALGACHRTAEIFAAAGGHLDYMTKVYMPENYILFSNVPSDKMIAKHIFNSNKRVADIANEVLACQTNDTKKTIAYRLVQKVSDSETEKWKHTAKSFRVSESCTKCKKCIRLCPVNNISIENDKIAFRDSCECCLLCIHACPQKSIDYAEKTTGKKRYINPNINIEDMKKY